MNSAIKQGGSCKLCSPQNLGEMSHLTSIILQGETTNWRQRGRASDTMGTWLTYSGWQDSIYRLIYVRMYVSMKKKAFIDVMYLFVCVLCVFVTPCAIPNPIQLNLFLFYLSWYLRFVERSLYITKVLIIYTYALNVYIRSLLLSDTALNASILAKPKNTINSQPATPHYHPTQLCFLLLRRSCLPKCLYQAALGSGAILADLLSLEPTLFAATWRRSIYVVYFTLFHIIFVIFMQLPDRIVQFICW